MIDFTSAVADDTEAETLIHEAQRLGYLVETALEQRPSGRLATVRLRRVGEPIVDLLFATCGIEAEIAADATVLSVLGQRVPVATVGHLIAMKLVSRDPKKRPGTRRIFSRLHGSPTRRSGTAPQVLSR